VTWRSKKQDVFKSSADAEYINSYYLRDDVIKEPAVRAWF